MFFNVAVIVFDAPTAELTVGAFTERTPAVVATEDTVFVLVPDSITV
jgi:hypothetical protein